MHIYTASDSLKSTLFDLCASRKNANGNGDDDNENAKWQMPSNGRCAIAKVNKGGQR